MSLFRKKTHEKYMKLLSSIRKVKSMKDTFECISATDSYKADLEDGLEWALSILQNREADLCLKIHTPHLMEQNGAHK